MAKHLKQTIEEVSLDQIDEPKGIIRMDIDPASIDELAQSISEVGLLQPILIAVDGDRFELVFGHRRYLASKKLGLSSILSRIRVMTQQEIGVARATENIARADLTPIEEAATYKNLIDEYKMTLDQVGHKFGLTGGTIKRRMDLLKMPPCLQKAVHKKQISMTVAEELWPISEPADLDYYLSFALDGGCTKEVARTWCKEWRDSKRRKSEPSGNPDSPPAVYAPRPVYVACDLCTGPMELGNETVLRVCPDCLKIVQQAK